VTKRILSTAVLWIVLCAVLWIFRTEGAVALIVLIAILTLREFYQLQAAAGRAPFAKLGMTFGGLIAAAPWLQVAFGWDGQKLLPMAVIIFSVRILGEREPERRVDSLASTLFGLVYVALMLQFLVRLVTPRAGDIVSSDGRLVLCIWTVAVAKFCDTGALLSGIVAGRHAMAPTISPKKTWEGAVGGVLAAILVGAGVAWAARRQLAPVLSPARAALLAAPIAVAAIISDLIESVLKRQSNRKDSGAAVPGIGGVFDVTDSLLLAAPVSFYLLGFK
jgi:phosphatidate cytidylyltransferase